MLVVLLSVSGSEFRPTMTVLATPARNVTYAPPRYPSVEYTLVTYAAVPVSLRK
jgi:hypothetical protein